MSKKHVHEIKAEMTRNDLLKLMLDFKSHLQRHFDIVSKKAQNLIDTRIKPETNCQ